MPRVLLASLSLSYFSAQAIIVKYDIRIKPTDTDIFMRIYHVICTEEKRK
jgi:hypothetical protein